MIKMQNKCYLVDANYIQNFVIQSDARFLYTELSDTMFRFTIAFDTDESYVKFNQLYDNHFNPAIYTEKPINKLKRFKKKLLQLFL